MWAVSYCMDGKAMPHRPTQSSDFVMRIKSILGFELQSLGFLLEGVACLCVNSFKLYRSPARNRCSAVNPSVNKQNKTKKTWAKDR